MKAENIIISFFPLWLSFALPVFSADASSGVPHGLTVEYIREPEKTRITDSQPEFGWIVPDEAIFQNAYQILVSSDKDKIKNNDGDIWDSGKVISRKSINIGFGGKALKENSIYFWKVRIWDRHDQLSEYSQIQVFRTGQFGRSVSSKNAFQVEKIAPVTATKTAEGTYFFDFGKDAFGTLELSYKSSENDTLIVCLGEKLLNGKLDPNPGGTIRYAEIKLPVIDGQMTYSLKLKPDKRNTGAAAVKIPDSLDVVMPFRYAEIKNALIRAHLIKQSKFISRIQKSF